MKLKTSMLACACAGALGSVWGQGPPASVNTKTVECSLVRANAPAIITDDCTGEVSRDKPESPGRAVPEGKGISSRPQTEAENLVVCSADGEQYAFATAEGRIKCCRTRDGVVSHTFYQCHPKALVFSADGRLLASAGGPNGSPGTIKVFRVSDGVLLCKLPNETRNNPLLSFSPDGLLLASSDREKSIQFWQIPEGSLKRSETVTRNVSALTWPKQGDALVAVFADGTSRLFRFR